MWMTIVWPAVVGLAGTTSLEADGEHRLQVVSSKSIPVVVSVTVHQTKNGKRESIADISQFDKPLKLPNNGPFEVFAKPKDGIPIKIVDQLTFDANETHELKLAELIGSVEVFGDNFPRAEKIVLTEERDPGPGEKGHVSVQVVTDYRIDMAAPPGFYAVWVIPANGAKAQRVVDRVRVMAGKSVRVGD